MKFLSYLIAPAVVVLILCMADAVMGSMDLPNYGVWTGIRPIEAKLKSLGAFAKAGPVDAIVFGSSISDFGFSAELYSKLMSEKLGRPYRVFNFSTGAAELVTTPGLIRIAMTAVTPAELIISAPPEIKRFNIISPASADYVLERAPVGAALDNESLMYWQSKIWNLPIMEKAAATRDMLLFGQYKNLLGNGMDTYPVNAYGDRLSYSAAQISEQSMRDLAQQDLISIQPLSEQAENDVVAARKQYFPDIDIDAMADIKKIAAANHMKIVVLGHSAAIHFWRTPTRDPKYLKGRNQYLDILAKSLDATLVNPLNELSTPDFAVMDGTHLNMYGAQIFTRAAFKEATSPGSPHPALDTIEQVPLDILRTPMPAPTFNTWSAILLHKADGARQILTCRFVQNFAVPSIPDTDLSFALRLPDGSDVVAPARKLATGEYQANLELKKSDKTQSIILRLLYGADKEPLRAPLTLCNWTAS